MSGKSLVAGIVDRKGGLRVVVDGDIRPHLGPGERAYILPDKVQEPIPLHAIPALVAKVEQYVSRMIAGNGNSRTDYRLNVTMDRTG